MAWTLTVPELHSTSLGVKPFQQGWMKVIVLVLINISMHWLNVILSIRPLTVLYADIKGIIGMAQNEEVRNFL